MARTSGLKYLCASSVATTKLTDKIAIAIRSSMVREKSDEPQKNAHVAYTAK